MSRKFKPLSFREFVRDSFKILDARSRRNLFFVFGIQSFLSILDLIGVALMGILGAVSVSGIQSKQTGGKVEIALELLQIENLNFQMQVVVLATFSSGVLIIRTALSVYFTRKILFFLSRKSGEISAKMVRSLFNLSIVDLQKKSIQENLYSVTTGVNAIMIGIIGTSISLATDFILLLLIFAGILAVDWTLAVSTLAIFGSISFILYKLLNQKARELGAQESMLSIKSSETIIEALNSFRETFVRNRRDFYSAKIESQRLGLSDVTAELAFMPNISKYVLEIAVLFGALIISAIQFWLQDAMHAVSTLFIFIAAGTRVAPAILRTQQGAIQIKSNLGSAMPTLELIQKLDLQKIEILEENSLSLAKTEFNAIVKLRNVSYKYPSAQVNAITDISLEIPSGSVTALVGPSGAGKTTIVDLILGILTPDSGEIRISEKSPISAIRNWPGVIGYVPQEVYIANASVRENIGLGFNVEGFPDSDFWDCLRTAQLEDLVRALEEQLNSNVGENGSSFSGGQRQRLGIARALFTKPKLLILDEATSALDGQTELAVSDAVSGLRGTATIILIAHRLSSVMHADLVVYVDEGRVLASGSFDEVRNLIPEFNQQAKLLGL